MSDDVCDDIALTTVLKKLVVYTRNIGERKRKKKQAREKERVHDTHEDVEKFGRVL